MTLLRAAFPQSLVPFSPREESLLFEVRNLILKHCMQLANNPRADARVRAEVFKQLHERFPEAGFGPWHLWLLSRYLEDPEPIASSCSPGASPAGRDSGSKMPASAPALATPL